MRSRSIFSGALGAAAGAPIAALQMGQLVLIDPSNSFNAKLELQLEQTYDMTFCRCQRVQGRGKEV
jgi:hypothetical protein